MTGFLADKIGSYEPAFYMSGAILIVGAAIPFLLLFIRTGPVQENCELTDLDNPKETQV